MKGSETATRKKVKPSLDFGPAGDSSQVFPYIMVVYLRRFSFSMSIFDNINDHLFFSFILFPFLRVLWIDSYA